MHILLHVVLPIVVPIVGVVLLVVVCDKLCCWIKRCLRKKYTFLRGDMVYYTLDNGERVSGKIVTLMYLDDINTLCEDSVLHASVEIAPSAYAWVRCDELHPLNEEHHVG